VKKTDQIRLHKFIAESGLASRREAERLIVAGKVTVNGQVIKELGTKIDPVRDKVRVGKRIAVQPERGILLLNKPRGVVSTLSDPEGRPTVADFLTKKYESYFPVGRLDWDSTGLMIMTNDGEVAERLMHPRYGFERTYEVRVEGSVSAATCNRIESGVRLEDGNVSGKVRLISNEEGASWLEIIVTEGRNRVIRRLMEKLGHPVIKLRRIAYGPFRLGKLPSGQIRKLTQKEYMSLRKKILARQVTDD
jgi:23S rRNA pseudouridine2605 synthase